MKTIFVNIIILLSGFFAYGQQYIIDSSFGTNGSQFLNISRELNGIAIRSNSEPVFCGYNNAPAFTYQLAVNALKYHGQPDSGFGVNGNTTTFFDTLTMAVDCAIQQDGKIVVAGTYSPGNTPQAPAIFHAYIFRYMPDGQVDSTFGIDGKQLLNLGTESSFAKVALLPDGKIVAGGNVTMSGQIRYLLAKYNTNGTYDTTFGINGIVMTAFPHEAGLWDLDVLPDGSIVASGNEGVYDPSPNPNFDIQMCIIKYHHDGKVDSSFGINGIVYNNIDSFTDDVIFNLHLQSDGKIITTGLGNNQGMIIRYLSNGSLDSSYDGDGMMTVTHVTRVSLLQAGDKLVTANNVLAGQAQDIQLLRYLPDASLDTSFGNNGVLYHDVPGNNNYIHDVAMDGMGNIIVCGSSDSGSIVARYRNPDAVANGVGDHEKIKFDIELYPNPAAEYIYAAFNTFSPGEYTIQIVDCYGKMMKTFSLQDHSLNQYTKIELPIAAFPAGAYNVRIKGEKASAMKSFIKH